MLTVAAFLQPTPHASGLTKMLDEHDVAAELVVLRVHQPTLVRRNAQSIKDVPRR